MDQPIERRPSPSDRAAGRSAAAALRAQGVPLAAVDGLAGAARSGDARAGHERKGEPMSEQQNGGPAHGGKDQQTPPDTVFDQPAPAGAAKKTSEVLGEIVWLMSQSPLHKQFFVSDLEWFVMTPMLLQQFRLFYDKQKPVGVVFWASVSEEVEARLAAGTSRMRPQDWKSGDRLWVVEAIAPFGGAEEMVKDLKAKVFPGREMKVLAVGAKGKEVRVV